MIPGFGFQRADMDALSECDVPTAFALAKVATRLHCLKVVYFFFSDALRA